MSTKTEDKELAKAPKTPLAIVSNQVRDYIARRRLILPARYSPENALKAAWLMLQAVVDREGKPVLQSCSQVSIVNTLMSMVIQALNPDKKQCYFIAYGKTLACQRSYFGDIALAKRVNPDLEVYCDVIYDGEKFQVAKTLGGVGLVTVVKEHVQAFPRDGKTIVGAYCGLYDTKAGRDLGIELMDMSQIKKSWAMSKTYKEGGTSPHNSFPDQMALRTVIRRRCKPVINSSDDELLLGAIRESDMDVADAEIAEDALENANGEILSIGAAAEAVPEAQGDAGDAQPETAEALGF